MISCSVKVCFLIVLNSTFETNVRNNMIWEELYNLAIFKTCTQKISGKSSRSKGILAHWMYQISTENKGISQGYYRVLDPKEASLTYNITLKIDSEKIALLF